MEEATYKINHDPVGKCICGHTASAHGRKGMICAACECKQFKEGHDSRRPVPSRFPKEFIAGFQIEDYEAKQTLKAVNPLQEIDSNGVIILRDGEKKS